ncbi:MAG: efflux RND transporter periplasmic adaptor subunit [Betaproteobacteria bacterium]|nr:efflux RND transporter periplasmic adaptor subunit [Betaproteobacteria bacterium]
MPRRFLWMIVAVVALAVAAVWLVDWWRGPLVVAYRVERRPLVQDVVATGRIITPSRISVASEITAVVIKRLVDRGDEVRPGQVLLELRSDQARAQRDQAQAALQQLIRQTRPQAHETLVSAESVEKLARSEEVRARAQVAQGAVSQQALEQAQQALAAAQAQVRSARAAWDADKPDGSAEMQLRAALAAANAVQERSLIRAEVAGQVLTRNVEVGDTITPGQILFTLARAGSTQVSLPVDEQNLEHLALGQGAQCLTDAFPNRPFDAQLTFIAPAVDTTSGTIELRLTVAKPPSWLRQDMTTSCDITTGQRAAALVVPNDVLRAHQGDSAQVLVLRAGRAQPQDITLGLQGLVASEVTKGLHAGDVVIAERSVQPHQRVRATLQGLPSTAASAIDTASSPRNEVAGASR